MSSVINTNSLSLLTQNNLTKSQSALNTSIQRLSSGLRINSAKDDAAGQAIANRFTSNIKGLTQASRNANDGISMAQTTEGALGEINTNLQRIRELTVQSQNATNSDADKSSIQAEIKQRLDEITRTSEQTDFNGTKVLNKDQSLSIQVGANDKEVINLDLKKMDLSALNLSSFNVDGTGTANTATTKDDFLKAVANTAANPTALNTMAYTGINAGTENYTQTLKTVTTNAAAKASDVFSKVVDTGTVVTGGSTYTYNATTKTFNASSAINQASSTVTSGLIPLAGGQTAATVKIGSTTQDILIDSSGNITAADDKAAMFLDTAGNLSKTSATGSTAAKIGGGGLGDLVQSMGDLKPGGAAASGTGGVITVRSGGDTATYTATTAVTGGAAWTNAVALSSATMQSKALAGASVVDIDGSANAAVGSYNIAAGANGAVTGTTSTYAVYVDVTTAPTVPALINVATGGDKTTTTVTKNYYVQAGTGVVTDNSGNKVYNDSASTGMFTLNDRSGKTSTAHPLDVLDKALKTVDTLRGALGAVQNRFDSVISNLGTTITNLSSSRSRIEDADYATEVSNMTRAQILQQAGTSVLAKANSSTEGVMSLLR